MADCPNPGKATWSTEAAAKAALARIRRTAWTTQVPRRAYPCACGNWHLSGTVSKKPKRRR